MKYYFSLFASALLLSCTSTSEESSADDAAIEILPGDSNKEDQPLPELAPAQQSALDALDTLQTTSDDMGRLFSTFANQEQTCYPPDTIFTLSQSEFHKAIEQFINENYTLITPEKRVELALRVAQAEKEYTVSLCLSNFTDSSFEEGVPMKGIWVLTNVLGRRDVVMDWGRKY